MPVKPALEAAIGAVRAKARYRANIDAMREREREFSGPVACLLAGIAADPGSRQIVDDAIQAAWDDRPAVPVIEAGDEVIAGGGLHAAVYAACRAAAGKPPPVVLERSARPGGAFAMSAGPVFWLNSGNRPGLTGRPRRGEALNVLPGAPVQPADISGSDYQSNADLAWIIRVTLAMYADVYPRVTVGAASGPEGEMDLDTSAGGYECRRVIDITGLGDPAPGPAGDAADAPGSRIVTFPRFMAAMDTLFPLRGVRRAAVIGGGDSGKVAVEALLGIGPRRDMSVAALDYVQAIDWYSGRLPLTCEAWRQEVRGRYQRIGSYLREGRVSTRLGQAQTVLPAGEFAVVDGRAYDLVVVCAGFRSRLTQALPLIPGGLGRRSGGFYVAGAAAGIPYDTGEGDFAGIPENRAAIFRLAPRTAALAALLD